MFEGVRLNGRDANARELLISAIDVLIDDPAIVQIKILRTENTAGIQSANVFVQREASSRSFAEGVAGKPEALCWQEFQEGDQTIYDKDPDWKNKLREAE